MLHGSTVLMFTAHPDDEVASAGTLAKLAASGNRVVLAIATDGDKGTHDPDVRPADIAATRRAEMTEAAAVLGIAEVQWLGFSDGTLEDHRAALKPIVYRLIRQHRPEVVFSFDPSRRWEPHPDHRTMGQVTLEAAFLADGCWYYPQDIAQGIAPHRTPEVYMFFSEEPNYRVDVRETFPLKARAAACHRSQGFDGGQGGFEARARARLQRLGRPESDLYVESFRKFRGSDVDI